MYASAAAISLFLIIHDLPPPTCHHHRMRGQHQPEVRVVLLKKQAPKNSESVKKKESRS